MKFNLSILIFLCIVHVSFAQSGMRVGLNLSNASFSTLGQDVETSTLLGLDIGYIQEFDISDKLVIQPEIHYGQYGYKIEAQSLEVGYDNIEIPILVEYKITEHNIRPFVYSGPYISYSVKGTITVNDMDEDVNFNRDINRADYGLKFGGGLEIGPIFIDIRYSLGLANRAKNESNLDQDYKTKALQIGAGYVF